MSKFNIIFPLLMVIGALGSLAESIVSGRKFDATSLQWFGAMLLYTALTIRNAR